MKTEQKLTKQEEKYINDIVKLIVKTYRNKKYSRAEKQLIINLQATLGMSGFILANIHKKVKKVMGD